MSSQQDKPLNPAPAEKKLMATLSEASSVKISDSAREELNRAVEARASTPTPSSASSTQQMARREVAEAAVKFTDGVDVITESLILILGKFKGVLWRTNLGMAFGGMVLVTCLTVARQTMKTALVQEENNRKVADLAAKFEDALRRLDKIQQSQNTTEQKVEAVRVSTDTKPSIEIVPDKARPGGAKLVIRSAPPPTSAALVPPPAPAGSGAPRPKAAGAAAPPAAPPDQVEIPLAIPKAGSQLQQQMPVDPP